MKLMNLEIIEEIKSFDFSDHSFMSFRVHEALIGAKFLNNFNLHELHELHAL